MRRKKTCIVSNGRDKIIHFTAKLTKIYSIRMVQYFSEWYFNSGENVNLQINISKNSMKSQ